ncbi:hypothetical protein LZ639_04010 [Pseudomonas stutzeri]|jgi:hypothetical protein|uniref:Uncharacterized protein n=1 Tax=Stutzerimonas stutzeri TaxID=316 RepID=A0A2N8RBG1_STUST|nr:MULTISPECIES: hypothetical protein [Gammaproteobacteria]EPL63058.1 hypothetical protein B382_09407 [Stutzerimonas stutzeri B1SMN1]NMY66619.1 hypothetical protein [Pseudomonas sp. WS 5018]OHC17878.1 MAG: hypothetical protein A2883_08010 [Pseudomonadales bacterium RIFCSPHIGHO2_01_FULL_64_12]HAB85815.1 hypothetical protein [Pseudomonas sp.]MBH3356210.1 hypothetical protein [Stutzerimonas stutzeri]
MDIKGKFHVDALTQEGVRSEIAALLGCDRDELPIVLRPDEVARILEVESVELEACPPHHGLPFIMFGSSVWYRLNDIIRLLANRHRARTNEVGDDG